MNPIERRGRALARRSVAAALHRAGLTRTRHAIAADTRANELAHRLDLQRRADRWTVADPPDRRGVNVVGFLHHQLALGDMGRRWVEVLRGGEVPTATVTYGLVPASPVHDPAPVDQHLAHADTLAVVPADHLGLLHDLHPELRDGDRRVVGYCYWEVETITDAMRRGAEAADEIWVHTRFIEDAFRNGTTTPVRRVPLPVAEPHPSGRGRADFPMLAAFADRPLLGVTFDYFSVLERKNPLGAVAAFDRAFRPGDGPVLVVKTLHGDRFPDQHAELLAWQERRPDVVVWDEQLTRADQMAFIAALDGLVSLHRAEGLGAHLAEAMWLGTPVVATGYSGNVDLMDDDNSLLVGHSMTPIVDGGGIYPTGARWAEPDLDHATEQLRRLVADDELRVRLTTAARATMEAQPDDAQIASDVSRRLGLA